MSIFRMLRLGVGDVVGDRLVLHWTNPQCPVHTAHHLATGRRETEKPNQCLTPDPPPLHAIADLCPRPSTPRTRLSTTQCRRGRPEGVTSRDWSVDYKSSSRRTLPAHDIQCLACHTLECRLTIHTIQNRLTNNTLQKT